MNRIQPTSAWPFHFLADPTVTSTSRSYGITPQVDAENNVIIVRLVQEMAILVPPATDLFSWQGIYTFTLTRLVSALMACLLEKHQPMTFTIENLGCAPNHVRM
jgi:hypothetical protein